MTHQPARQCDATGVRGAGGLSVQDVPGAATRSKGQSPWMPSHVSVISQVASTDGRQTNPAGRGAPFTQQGWLFAHKVVEVVDVVVVVGQTSVTVPLPSVV